MAKIASGSNQLVLRRITHNKGKLLLSHVNANVLDIFRRKFTEIKLEASEYGTHSFRAGGGIAAANNTGGRM
jgi:hypothetical protein